MISSLQATPYPAMAETPKPLTRPVRRAVLRAGMPCCATEGRALWHRGRRARSNWRMWQTNSRFLPGRRGGWPGRSSVRPRRQWPFWRGSSGSTTPGRCPLSGRCPRWRCGKSPFCKTTRWRCRGSPGENRGGGPTDIAGAMQLEAGSNGRGGRVVPTRSACPWRHRAK